MKTIANTIINDICSKQGSILIGASWNTAFPVIDSFLANNNIIFERSERKVENGLEVIFKFTDGSTLTSTPFYTGVLFAPGNCKSGYTPGTASEKTYLDDWSNSL